MPTGLPTSPTPAPPIPLRHSSTPVARSSFPPASPPFRTPAHSPTLPRPASRPHSPNVHTHHNGQLPHQHCSRPARPSRTPDRPPPCPPSGAASSSVSDASNSRLLLLQSPLLTPSIIAPIPTNHQPPAGHYLSRPRQIMSAHHGDAGLAGLLPRGDSMGGDTGESLHFAVSRFPSHRQTPSHD